MNESHYGTSVCNEKCPWVVLIGAHKWSAFGLSSQDLTDSEVLVQWRLILGTVLKGNKYFSAERPLEMQTIIFAGFSYLLYKPLSITVLLKECTKHSGWALDLKGKPQYFKINTPTNLRKKTPKKNSNMSEINKISRNGSNLLKVDSWIDVFGKIAINELYTLLQLKDWKYFKVSFHRQNIFQSQWLSRQGRSL